MKPSRKTLIFWGLLSLILLISLVALYYKERLDEKVEFFVLNSLREALGPEVKVKGVKLHLIPTVLTLEEITLPQEKPEHDRDLEKPFFSAKEVRIVLSRWSLLTEVLVITSITFRGPEFSLIRTAGGQMVWPDLAIDFPAGTGEDQDRKFLIRRINVEDGRVVYEDRNQDWTLDLGEVQGSVRPGLRMRNFEVEFSARRGEVSYKQVREKDMAIRGKLGIYTTHIDLSRLELSLSDDSRLSLNGKITDLNTAKPAIRLLGEAIFQKIPFPENLPITSQLSGAGRTQFQIRGVYPELQVQGSALLEQLRFNSVSILEGETDFKYSGGTLIFERIKGESLGGHLNGNLILNLLQAPVIFKAEVQAKDLRSERIKLLVNRDLVPPEKKISGEIKATGEGFSVEGLRAQGRLQATSGRENRRFPKPSPSEPTSTSPSERLPLGEALEPFEQIEIQFELAQGGPFEMRSVMQSPASSVRFEGTAGLDGTLGLDFTLATQDAREITGLLGIHPRPVKPRFLDLAGPLRFSGHLKGTMESPILEGNLVAEQVQIRGHEAGFLETDLGFREGILGFKRAILAKAPARYEFSGEIDFASESGPQFDLDAALSQVPVGEVITFFYKEIPIDATGRGALVIKGKPNHFTVLTKLGLEEAALYGQHFDRGEVEMQITNSEITFSKVSLTKGRSELDGSGWLAFDNRFQTQISSQTFHLEDFDYIHHLIPAVQADLSLEFRGSGSFQTPELHGQARIREIRYSDEKLGSGKLSMTLMGRNLAFEASIEQTEVSGLLRLEKDLPIKADVSYEALSLEPFLRPSYPELLEKVSLLASGRMLISGKALDPLSLHIESTFTYLSADIAGYKVTNQGDQILEFQNGNLQVKSFQLTGEGTSLSISGETRLGKSLNLFVNGEADLNVFRLITDEFSYGEGKAYLVLKLTDQWDDPNITGGLTVQEGTLRSETLRQTLTITSMGLFFNQRQVLLEDLEGKTSGGFIKATGKIELKNLLPDRFGLMMDLSGITASLGEEGSLIFGGNFIFQGDPESRQLRGEARIERATYTDRVDLKVLIPEFQRRQAQPPAPTPFVGTTKLDIHIFGRDHVWIDNNLAKLPMEIDLFLKGTYDRPQLYGHIEARDTKGEIYFRRHVFRVQSGTLDFINPDRIAPVVDLRAETTIRIYRVEMNLTGRMDKGFDLGLTSDPPLSETDILALLAVGKTAEELAELPGAQATGDAISVPTSMLFDEFIEDKVKEITGIDRFQVDPYSTSSRAAAGPRLTVQKRLLDEKLTVTYISAVDPAEEEVIKLEYELGRSVSLIGERDEKGRAGGDIKFRLEFR